jgi:hypothetical protein
MYCVVDEVIPILRLPGGDYEILGYDGFGDDVTGIVVYGNNVKCASIDGALKDSWLELLNPDNGESLGFIPWLGLEPIPDMKNTYNAKPYLVKKDNADLFLMPGKNEEKYNMAKYNFRLIKGEVVSAYGETQLNDEVWTMLGFSTSEDDSGDSGVGLRCAWAKTSDLVSAEEYAPDNSRVPLEWLPTSIRRYFDFERWLVGHDSIDVVPDSMKSQIKARAFWINPEPVMLSLGYDETDDMADLYRHSGNYSVDFITTDIYLHAFHLIFDQMLERVETAYLAPALSRGMVSVLAELERVRPNLRNTKEDENSFETAHDMFAISAALIAGESGEKYSERAASEIKRIMSASVTEASLITGARIDYTQYKPRGHYTKSPEQERYFRAMTWLGEAGIPLFASDGAAIAGNVRAAALMVLALDSLGEKWSSFDEPIDFLVGKSDDGAYGEYLEIVKRDIVNVKNLSDSKKIEKLADDIKKNIAPPQIHDRQTGVISRGEEDMTRTPEFRVSGKRFTFDSYIFNQLTSPRVGSDSAPRNMPRGTDVMAVLGALAAGKYAQLSEVNYKENLERLKEEWPKYIGAADTVYALWLKTLSESFKDSGSKQFFYRSGAWGYKKLITASASWAELKHDTVLYGEQSGAEMGDGGWYAGKFAPPYPRGYVEPDPQTFAALIEKTDRLLEFFEKFKFEDRDDQEYSEKLASFKALCETAYGIAKKEAEDAQITAEDYRQVKKLAWAWDDRLLLPGGATIINEEDPNQLKMAIVSDVATDFAGGEVLYAATGKPREIFVYVNDKSGGSRIARGFVYSYYEFARPLSDGRMNDAEWKKLIYDSEEDMRQFHPAWYSEIYTDWK